MKNKELQHIKGYCKDCVYKDYDTLFRPLCMNPKGIGAYVDDDGFCNDFEPKEKK